MWPVFVLLAFHLTCAAGATITFWGAALSRKGGPMHRASGAWFARLVYATAASGAVLAALNLFGLAGMRHPVPAAGSDAERQTMWLVLYVLLIIVAPVQHGVAVARATGTPARVRSRAHATLCILSMVGTLALLPAALLWGQPYFLIVAPIGLVVGLRNLAYAERTSATRPEWEIEHATSQVTAGITLHTALLVFGVSRTLELQLAGGWALLPWTLPAVLGLPVISVIRSRRTARQAGSVSRKP